MRLRLSLLAPCAFATVLAAACGSSSPGGSGFQTDSGGGGPFGEGGIGGDGGFSFGDGSSGGDSGSGGVATCSDAANAKSYIGCDYWPTPVGNAIWSIFDFAVVVANTLQTTANVTVTGPNGFNQQATVGSGQLAKIYLPWVAALKGPDADSCGSAANFVNSVTQTGGAYHLVSTSPVTVYQFNALEYKGQGGPPGKSWAACPGDQVCPLAGVAVGCFSFSNDASLLLPSTAMTGNYRFTGIHSIQGLGGYFAVTGTQSGTNVSIKLSGSAKVGAGGTIQAAAPGSTLTFTLNAGDVAEIVGDGTNNVDLSGSLLKADKPVQVIGGISCISIPDGIDPNTGSQYSCDHVEESVFPAETLGKHYVVTVPTGPNGSPVGHLVRFYGNADGTQLTFSPSAPAGCPTSLVAGQVSECGIVTQDFEVTGNHEFAVGSFMESAGVVDPNGVGANQKGDPSMSFPTAVEQYRTNYIFLAPSDYDVNYADIVAPPGTMLTLDGSPVSTSAIPVDGSFGVVRVPLSVGGNNGAHVIAGNHPIGIQVLGYGSYTSYQYPGGLDLTAIAPPPPK